MLAALTLAGCGTLTKTPEPEYSVVRSDPPFEIREYAPMVVAQVEVTGERDEAINRGFRLLADYIFGGNDGGEGGNKIAMTAPVLQEPAQAKDGENIAMTAPVTQESANAAGNWVVTFVMPPGRTLDSLPKPDNAVVKLSETPAHRRAVVRFSGFAPTGKLKEKEAELSAWVADQKLAPLGTPVYAFYNPPWTLPFLRRNEVMVPVN